MADESALQHLCDETTCPICLEYFKDPVTVDCGHNFCQACLTQYWGKPGREASCPQCREPCPQRDFKPNRQLASIVEIAKKFRLQMTRGAEALGKVCERHQEPLKLFCEDDQALICVVCDKSKEHREHKVIPKEEAFEEYKEKIVSQLELVNKERERILVSKLNVATEGQDLLKQTEIEREKIVAEFKQLHQFLEEQECRLLAKLKDLDDEIKATRNQHIAELSEKMSSMENLVKVMEEKQQQPADEFLQDIQSILQRCDANEWVKSPVFSPELKERLEKFSKIHPFLKPVIKTFQDTVLSRIRENEECLTGDMAVPRLFLSSLSCQTQGRQSFGFGNHLGQGFGFSVRAPIMEMYYCWSSTMGTERINSGRHSWVVDVGQRRYWTVGVAKQDLRELNQIHLSPERRVWAMGKLSLNSDPYSANDDTYCAFPPPGIPLGQFWIPSNFKINNPSVSPTRIRVSLDYEQGSVTFSDADTHDLIYTFNNASFAGAKLCSWLSVGQILKWQCSLPHQLTKPTPFGFS
nr:zinc finger protein RFP-like isoform X2 [Pogona vitticeps]